MRREGGRAGGKGRGDESQPAFVYSSAKAALSPAMKVNLQGGLHYYMYYLYFREMFTHSVSLFMGIVKMRSDAQATVVKMVKLWGLWRAALKGT